VPELKLITASEMETAEAEQKIVYPHFWIQFDRQSFEAWKRIMIDYLKLLRPDQVVGAEIRLPRGKQSEKNRTMLILVEQNLAQLVKVNEAKTRKAQGKAQE